MNIEVNKEAIQVPPPHNHPHPRLYPPRLPQRSPGGIRFDSMMIRKNV